MPATQSTIILNKIISQLVKAGASLLHLEVGAKPILRVDQALKALDDFDILTQELLLDIVQIILPEDCQKTLTEKKEAISTHTFEGGIRFKIHAFYQKNNLSLIFTYIPSVISDPVSIGVTPEFINLLKQKQGLIIVSGYHGSGRSTTVLSLLNHINTHLGKYILTIEKPIEYILTSNKSIIDQREVGRDVSDFISALNFTKDSDVDVVYISEVKDYLTLRAVLDIIASGRLVIMVTEANSVADAVGNLVELASDGEAEKIRYALTEFLRGVVVQQLVPRRGGGQITVTEIMLVNAAIIALIKEGRYAQITSVLQTSRDSGMRSLDQALLELLKTGELDFDAAYNVAVNKVDFKNSAQKFKTNQ